MNKSVLDYYLNRALISLTAGAALVLITNNLWLGLGFAGMLFGLYALNARNRTFPDGANPSTSPAVQQEGIVKAILWGLAAAIVVFILMIVVATRSPLPFQPAGFALIVGMLAGFLSLYLQKRQNKPKK
jgi:energy-coupling factor transporter transmembrane protein EcfT